MRKPPLNLGTASIEPAFVDLLVRVNLNRGQILMSQHCDPLLAIVFLEQSRICVDMSTDDQSVSPTLS